MAALQAMEGALRHRGPDGNGHYRSGDVGMVQTRLAIIDLATGDQPLYEPGGAALIANGEIYNYIELRREFRRPRSFATGSDCELPLHLYRRLRARLRHVICAACMRIALARSRRPGGWCWRAIRSASSRSIMSRRRKASPSPPSPQALIARRHRRPRRCSRRRATSCCNCSSPPAAKRSSPGIHRVLPGETVVVDQGPHRRAPPHRGLARRAAPIAPEDEARRWQRFDRAFADSVMRASARRRALRHVPLGRHRFLGRAGDDGAAQRAPGQGLHRSASRTPSQPTSARRARKRRARRSAPSMSRSSSARPISGVLLPEIARAMDDPAADYAILPTYKLAAERARGGAQGHPVSGEGGDELFAGYGRYRSVMRPWWAGGTAAAGARQSRQARHPARRSRRSGATASRQPSCTPACRAARGLQVAQAADCADWLPNDLLTKLDRCLMAHGVEGRTPFLDPVVAAFRVPPARRAQGEEAAGQIAVAPLARRARAGGRSRSRRSAASPCRSANGSRGAARSSGRSSRASRACARSACPARSRICSAQPSGKRAGFAAWTLLFYALWHRRHIERLPPGPDVFATLGMRAS